MKLIIILLALSGCHLVFGVDVPEYVYITGDAPERTDARIDATFDGRPDGSTPPDAPPPIDAPVDSSVVVVDSSTVDADLTTIVSFALPDRLCPMAQTTGRLQLSAPISAPFTVTLSASDASVSFPTPTYTFQPATWATPITVPVDVGAAGAAVVDIIVTAPDGVFILSDNLILCF
jgi:hypothetical protein